MMAKDEKGFDESSGKRVSGEPTAHVHPETTGEYRIYQVIGQGATGVVYQGFDPRVERVVAIRVIKKDRVSDEERSSLRQRFKRDAEAAGQLRHPNIVTVYEYGEDNGSSYLVMEYVEGSSLDQYTRKKKGVSVKEAVSITKKLLSALDHSHSKGVIHGDIRPANVFILENGEVKLSDFGIAKMETSDPTRPGTAPETPDYMSPEQIGGEKVDARSDLFSVGVLFFEMATGERPFGGSKPASITSSILNSQYEDPCSLNPDLPEPFREVIEKALSRRPADRYQSAGEFARALRQAVEKSPAVVMSSPAIRKGNKRLLAAIVLGPLLATVAGAGVWFWSCNKPGSSVVANSETEIIEKQESQRPGIAVSQAEAYEAVSEPPASGAEILENPPPHRTEYGDDSNDSKSSLTGDSKASGEKPATDQLLQPGRVRINSRPEGADVFIDGKLMGSTPFEGILDPGPHRLSLKKNGFTELEDEFTIDEFSTGGPFVYDAELFRGFE